LLIGTEVVEFIKSPLTEALGVYFEGRAVSNADKVIQEYKDAGLETPYDLAGLQELIRTHHVDSEPLLVNPPQIAELLHRNYPGAFDLDKFPRNAAGHVPSMLGPWRVIPTDLADPVKFCSDLAAAGKQAPSTPAGKVWKLLDEQQQKDLTKWAAMTSLTEKDKDDVTPLQKLCDLLNDLITSDRLGQADALSDLPLQGQARELYSRREKLDLEQSRRLNRLMLEAAMGDTLARSYPDLMQLFIWHKIEGGQQGTIISMSPQEAFLIYIKASLITGLVLGSPWIFWQIWSFVAAGLYPHERKYVHVFLPFSLGLFLLGASTAFFFVFEPVLSFLFNFNTMLGIEPTPRISEWLSFVLILPLGFGISFQLPLVMLFLERIGIFSVEAYIEKWRVAILVIFIISMLLTPADPTSMLLMAMPLSVLYALGVLLCRYMPSNRNPFDEPAA
jgi:sec-independent protein translocase protein TatC